MKKSLMNVEATACDSYHFHTVQSTYKRPLSDLQCNASVIILADTQPDQTALVFPQCTNVMVSNSCLSSRAKSSHRLCWNTCIIVLSNLWAIKAIINLLPSSESARPPQHFYTCLQSRLNVIYTVVPCSAPIWKYCICIHNVWIRARPIVSDWKKEAGVSNNVNNGSVLSVCPSEPWQVGSHCEMTAVRRKSAIIHSVTGTCSFLTATPKHVF